jgi:hypothetical protein
MPARNASARLRRPVAVLAALVAGLLTSAASIPAAFAMVPDSGCGRSRYSPGVLIK